MSDFLDGFQTKKDLDIYQKAIDLLMAVIARIFIFGNYQKFLWLTFQDLILVQF